MKGKKKEYSKNESAIREWLKAKFKNQIINDDKHSEWVCLSILIRTIDLNLNDPSLLQGRINGVTFKYRPRNPNWEHEGVGYQFIEYRLLKEDVKSNQGTLESKD